MNYLLPTKHSHPDKTILAAALLITKKLRKNRVSRYDDLLFFLKEKNSEGEYLFIPAVNFLYLTGILTYHPKNDSFEYIGK